MVLFRWRRRFLPIVWRLVRSSRLVPTIDRVATRIGLDRRSLVFRWRDWSDRIGNHGWVWGEV